MRNEPALAVGIATALLTGFFALVGVGGLNDGLQWGDLVVVLGPVAAALGIRQKVTPVNRRRRA